MCALWNRVQTLPAPAVHKVHSLYGDHFPIEVRYVLADWIEQQLSGDVDPDNPVYESNVSSFVGALIGELEMKANAMVEDPYLIRVKLLQAAGSFRQMYGAEPHRMFRFLRHALSVESALVEQAESGAPNELGATSDVAEALRVLKTRTLETADILRRMEQEQEAFALKCHERQKLEQLLQIHRLQNNPPTIQSALVEKNCVQSRDRLEFELKTRITALVGLKGELEEKISVTVGELAGLQGKVLDEELTRWKREQQLAGNGAPLTNTLDTLQGWCEDLAELIWHNRHQLKEADRLKTLLAQPANQHDIHRLPALQEKVTQLLSSLVTSTFIVEKQPPQVMKTNTRFTATVRLLVGGRLNVHMTPPQVKVAIISESQANALLRNDKEKPTDTSGEILNNTGTMEYHQGTRHLSVHFRNMQLKRIKRAEKKGTESVMDEKFCLHFQCQFTVGEKELIFKIWTLSLPVVVIVHGNQEPHAWATVTWDNAFGEPGRMPFHVPERVPWFRVANALNVKFKSMTGRALTEDNLRFLGEKAFRSSHPGSELSWSQFCKEPLPDRNFTFWEWFYAIMKLTREHLRGPWVDGSIVGFVGRQQAEDLLAHRPNGTFLLRFSDSELGGITIAWTHQDHQVFSIAPFASKDLSTRSLPDRVNDLNTLAFLFPDVPKAVAFSKYYTPQQEMPPSARGYVRPQLITHIPGLAEVDVVAASPSHFVNSPSDYAQENSQGILESFAEHFEDFDINFDFDAGDPVANFFQPPQSQQPPSNI